MLTTSAKSSRSYQKEIARKSRIASMRRYPALVMRNLYAREIKLRVLTNQRYPQLRNRRDEESHLGRKLMFTSLYFKSSWRWLIRSVLHFLCSANCLKSVIWSLFIRCRSLPSTATEIKHPGRKMNIISRKKKKKPPWYPQRSDEPGLLDGWPRCRVWLQSSFNGSSVLWWIFVFVSRSESRFSLSEGHSLYQQCNNTKSYLGESKPPNLLTCPPLLHTILKREKGQEIV